MNPTLQKLREIAQASALNTQGSALKKQQVMASCAELAAPLIRAFQDVEKEYVRITILRQIWPGDYDRRNDQVGGLLVMLIGSEQAPSGLKMAMPQGFLTFEVVLKSPDAHVFRCIRETAGQRPLTMEFPDGERWLEYFYKVISDVIEL